MVFRPAPLLTLLSLASLIVLCGLGAWQWARMEEKAAAFARVEARLTEPALAPAQLSDDPSLEYRKLDAVLTEPRAVSVFGASGRVFQRAMLADGRFILAETGVKGATAAPGAPIVGVLRRIATDPALPSDDPSKGLYFQPGPGLLQALSLEPDAAWYLAAETLATPTGQPLPNPRADPRQNRVGPERHLGYALTWFGLALGLIAIYLLLHQRMGRFQARPS